MFDRLWWLITWCMQNLPWLVIALAAAVVLMKRQKSLPLSLQVIGAGGFFILKVAYELIWQLLEWMKAYKTLNMAETTFTFLLVVAMLLFMAGYCWEKMRQWRAAPEMVTALPVLDGATKHKS